MRLFFVQLLFIIAYTIPAHTFTITFKKLSVQEVALIGDRIWHNECGKSTQKLLFWNKHEEFPSLGIGHFIWLPKECPIAFNQTFPDLLAFLKKNNVVLPEWLARSTYCPWPNRELFIKEQSSMRMKQLHDLLIETRTLQAQFIIEHVQHTINKIIKTAPPSSVTTIKKTVELLTQTAQGIYALVDYVNFKGEGLNTKERYNSKGWGLLHVLEHMNPKSSADSIVTEFVRSAKERLSIRIANAPSNRNEQQFKQGWFNRLDTYLTPIT